MFLNILFSIGHMVLRWSIIILIIKVGKILSMHKQIESLFKVNIAKDIFFPAE